MLLSQNQYWPKSVSVFLSSYDDAAVKLTVSLHDKAALKKSPLYGRMCQVLSLSLSLYMHGVRISHYTVSQSCWFDIFCDVHSSVNSIRYKQDSMVQGQWWWKEWILVCYIRYTNSVMVLISRLGSLRPLTVVSVASPRYWACWGLLRCGSGESSPDFIFPGE